MREICVSNPGTHPELRHLAAGLTRLRDVSTSYVTASQLSSQSTLAKLFPVGIGLGRQLTSRSISAAEISHVTTYGFTIEALFQLSRRTSFDATSDRLMRSRNRYFSARASRLIRKRHPQIVVAQQTAASGVFRSAPDAIKVLNYPIAHYKMADDILGEEASLNPSWAEYLQFQSHTEALRLCLDREVELADYFLAGSEFVRKSLVEFGVEDARILITPYGVAAPTAVAARRSTREQNADDKLHVLFVGQVNQRKGISYLIDAISILGTKVKATIVGPVSATMRRRLAHYPNITVRGPLPKERVAALYTEADVFVLPSLVEGFALSALEAMSYGLPVILSSHTGVNDVIVDGMNGFVVPIRNADAIAERIVTLQDPRKRAVIGDAARRTSLELSWEAYERTSSTALHRLLR